MLPSFAEEIVGLEREKLRARACSVGIVFLDQVPPFVRDRGGREGEEVSGVKVVGLSRGSCQCCAEELKRFFL